MNRSIARTATALTIATGSLFMFGAAAHAIPNGGIGGLGNLPDPGTTTTTTLPPKHHPILPPEVGNVNVGVLSNDPGTLGTTAPPTTAAPTTAAPTTAPTTAAPTTAAPTTAQPTGTTSGTHHGTGTGTKTGTKTGSGTAPATVATDPATVLPAATAAPVGTVTTDAATLDAAAAAATPLVIQAPASGGSDHTLETLAATAAGLGLAGIALSLRRRSA